MRATGLIVRENCNASYVSMRLAKKEAQRKMVSSKEIVLLRHISVLDELINADDEPYHEEFDDRSYCGGSPHVALVLERLNRVPLAHRPSSIEKFAQWLHRNRFCLTRIKELVTPAALVSAIRAQLEPGDSLIEAIPDFDCVQEVPNIHVAAAARRTLLKLRKQCSSFESKSMLQRVKWLYAEAYGILETTPDELIQELKRYSIIRQRCASDGTQKSEIFYPVDMDLTWQPSREVDRFWQVPQLQLRVKGVSYDRSYCDTASRQSISEWLAKMGCAIVFEGMDAVLTLQPARAELLAHELPAILRLLISIEPAFLSDHELVIKDISKLIGKSGSCIKALQANHQLRLTISGQKIGGWVSPEALPADVTSESLNRLGQKLREKMLASKSLLESSLQVGPNINEDSSREAIQIDETNSAELVEVVVFTLAGEELMRKNILRCTPSVTLRKQLERAFDGRRAQMLFNGRVILDRDTFEPLATEGNLLSVQVLFTEKTARQRRLEQQGQIRKQLSEVDRRLQRLKKEYEKSAKHKDRFRMSLVDEARRRCLLSEKEPLLKALLRGD
jgi:hypothetical protein